MKALIVGGNFGDEPKESKIIRQAYKELKMIPDKNVTLINGGTEEQLKDILSQTTNFDLIIWMPNVSNDMKGYFPKKKKGAVLICSKVMRKGTTEIDAVSRIFKFSGNAVITIDTTNPKFEFKLIDALGNVWTNTVFVRDIVRYILQLYEWTGKSLRINTSKTSQVNTIACLPKLLEINKFVSQQCQKSFGERFFGNLSTRCTKLFPSSRLTDNTFLMSARNSNKDFLGVEDMILINGTFEYSGERKPSVDAPVQISIYNKFPNINFMIHGHAYIKNAIYTKKYRPCGDVFEADEVWITITEKYPSGVESLVNKEAVNLKNHGFLLMAETIKGLEEMVIMAIFEAKGIEGI